MAEAALRSSGGAMAEGTPQKRSRDPEGSCSAFQTPEPKRLRGFPGIPSPSRKSRGKLFASQIRWSPSSDEESKENAAFPGNSARARRLEISPFPRQENGNLPGIPLPTNPANPTFPWGLFYGKARSYLDPLERETAPGAAGIGRGGGAGNILGKTGNPGKNPRNPGGNSSRNPSCKVKTNPGRIPGAPKVRKEKAEIPEGEAEREFRENSRKKAEWPRRVLRLGVRPALRLPLGSAFFGSGKKSHSRKKPGYARAAPRAGPGSAQPGAAAPGKVGKIGIGGGREGEELGKIPKPREEQQENGEESVGCGKTGKSPRKSGNGAGDSQAGAAGSGAEEFPGASSCPSQDSRDSLAIPSPDSRDSLVVPSRDSRDSLAIPSRDSRDSLTIPSQDSRDSLAVPSRDSRDSLAIPSPAKGEKDRVSQENLGNLLLSRLSRNSLLKHRDEDQVYPIFIPGPGSRRRPLAELPCPFGSSPCGKSSPSSHQSRRAKESSQHSRDQMIIDAGQRGFGPEQCVSCGMLYSPAMAEDRLQHLRHHRHLRERLRCMGWKNERVVAEFWDGKIVLILPGDPKYAVRKAEEIREIVDNELGFQPVALRCPEKTRSYLFVSPGKNVLGCLVAEGITQAFRVLSEPGPAPLPDSQHSQDSRDSQDSQPFPRAWRCSLDPEPAVCGISRIWVLGSCRRRGIARRMVDVLRRTFVFGAVLNSRDLAFSDPTPDGRGFAARYCGDPNFLVYNFLHGAPGSGSSGSSGSGSSGSA